MTFDKGDLVKVGKPADSEMNPQYIGLMGEVVENNDTEGFPEGVCVKFSNGNRDMFWPEELEKVQKV